MSATWEDLYGQDVEREEPAIESLGATETPAPKPIASNVLPSGPGAEGRHHAFGTVNVERQAHPLPAARRSPLPFPSLSAEKHWSEQVHHHVETAERATGFAFAPKATQELDLGAIRAYVAVHNDESNDASAFPQNVTHTPKPATKQTEFTVTHHFAADDTPLPPGSDPNVIARSERRTYSTHEDGGQLYPISGDGIFSGVGAAQMRQQLTLAKIPVSEGNESYLQSLEERQRAKPTWAADAIAAEGERKEQRAQNREERKQARKTGQTRTASAKVKDSTEAVRKKIAEKKKPKPDKR